MHLSDEALAALEDEAPSATSSARAHLDTCATCRRRRDELFRLRAMLAETAKFERHPRRDVIPGALKRLRLRRHTVTNANEFLGGLVAFVRGFASLFAVPDEAAGRYEATRATARKREPRD